ncbi:hypothetical protein CDL15_Pgr017321 [Punica granatum]|nr:hypothetical protein CDL15_Pgr017321 [Punica granatum]
MFAPLPPSRNVLATADLQGSPTPVDPLSTPQGAASVEGDPIENSKKRKIIHRDVERQRRQEMASLYRSLRSHLPLELLKGKRSTSDHVHQAVGYIKNLQNKIQELSRKRDELKRAPQLNKTDDPKTFKGLPRTRRQVILSIKPCIGGEEIIISTDSRHGVALSKVLGFLTLEGMNVTSCTSVKVNGRLLHSVKSEVIRDDGNHTTNPSQLKQKLMNLLH